MSDRQKPPWTGHGGALPPPKFIMIAQNLCDGLEAFIKERHPVGTEFSIQKDIYLQDGKSVVEFKMRASVKSNMP